MTSTAPMTSILLGTVHSSQEVAAKARREFRCISSTRTRAKPTVVTPARSLPVACDSTAIRGAADRMLSTETTEDLEVSGAFVHPYSHRQLRDGASVPRGRRDGESPVIRVHANNARCCVTRAGSRGI